MLHLNQRTLRFKDVIQSSKSEYVFCQICNHFQIKFKKFLIVI